jgi:hypothetical protein
MHSTIDAIQRELRQAAAWIYYVNKGGLPPFQKDRFSISNQK